MIENQDITEILKDDIDDGDDILEALLVELEAHPARMAQAVLNNTGGIVSSPSVRH